MYHLNQMWFQPRVCLNMAEKKEKGKENKKPKSQASNWGRNDQE